MNKVAAAEAFLDYSDDGKLLDIYPGISKYTINEICDFLDPQKVSLRQKALRLVNALSALTTHAAEL